jgi:hypothetical protein
MKLKRMSKRNDATGGPADPPEAPAPQAGPEGSGLPRRGWSGTMRMAQRRSWKGRDRGEPDAS